MHFLNPHGAKRCRFRLALLLLIGFSVLSACNTNQTTQPPRGIGVTPSVPVQTQPGQPSLPQVSTAAVPSPHGTHILSSYSASYALLIGESDYSIWPRLGSIPGELQQLQTLLSSKGFQVEKSLNLNAKQLRARFEKFINDYGFDKHNRLLFFYSGHGYTRNNKGYIVPTDAPNPEFDEKGFLQKAVGMNQILTWARRMEAKHALFLFDSCFSGTVFKAKSLPKMPRQISQMAQLPVRQFITAGSADEEVPAKSVFTPAFIDALQYGLGDLYKDGYVTGEELGLYLKNKVPQHSEQTPQYGKIRDYELSRGDFVFAVGGGTQLATASPPQMPPLVPPPVPVSPAPPLVPAVKPDSDRDGVVDEADQCPRNTAAEIAKGVQKQGPQIGCPLDSDRDQVADYQDSCPYNRPAEVAQGVQANGCPTDSDRDGVADYRDQCPRNRPREIAQGVQANGCALDRDQDGVADYQDACLGTAAGAKVDSTGCRQSAPMSLAAMPPKTVFRDTLRNGTKGPKMVVIPAGRFKMGDIQGNGDSDEKPVHWVSVNKFALGKYEVTKGEFRQFVNATGYKTDAEKEGYCYSYKKGSWGKVKGANWRNPGFYQSDKHPVTCVSWHDATAYAEWLSQQTRKQYRLPTEAQWEYAARAGTTTSRYWGNNPDDACRYANIYDKTSENKMTLPWTPHNCSDGYVYTAPVGRFKPNAFGLFDMIGNLWEWTCSEYQNKYTGTEQRCIKRAGRFAARGASWSYRAWWARSAYRFRDSPSARNGDVGVRLARMP
jgi:formylglycine-generating enzyme required for sulfatase activity